MGASGILEPRGRPVRVGCLGPLGRLGLLSLVNGLVRRRPLGLLIRIGLLNRIGLLIRIGLLNRIGLATRPGLAIRLGQTRPGDLVVFFGLTCALAPPATAVADTDRAMPPGGFLVRTTQESLGRPAAGDTLWLAHRMIDATTLRVWRDSLRFEAGRDFEPHLAGGYLLWLRDAPPGEAVRASYRFLDLDLPAAWSLVRDGPAPDTLRLTPRAPQRRELPAGARIQVGGSKTFALEFGNRQDVSLTQSLDLTLRGQLAPDVEVRAVLTDRNLPIQPEGTTAELSDLDKVFIEVRAPWGLANLGDIRVEEHGMRFLSHSREMEGALLRAEKPGTARGAAAVGRSVGVSRSTRLAVQEGKQGPYVLVSRDPADEEVLVAGSEQIWLDGERLRRGEDADYTIDYASGELRFTSRRPVLGTQEVRVDFQVRQGGFERGYYWLQSAAGTEDRQLAIAYLREADDPDRSPLIPIGDEEREALAEAGDSTSAVRSGIEFVGAGEGPYELVEVDSLESPIFVYLGTDEQGDYRGAYEVDFRRVEDGKGDYRDSTLTSGETIYVYRGYRQADYLPGRRLPLPESRDVLAARTRLEVTEDLTLEAEGSVSWHDQNVLSPKDDGDNDGQAVFLSGRWRPVGSLGLSGGRSDLVELAVEHRDVSETYSSPEPLDPAFYHRRWNADPDVLDGHDRRTRAGLTVRPGAGLALSSAYERVAAKERFEGRRWTLGAERTGTLHGHLRWRTSRSEADGVDGTEQGVAARLGWDGPVRLEGDYEAEDLRRGAEGAADGQSYQRLQWSGAYERPASGLTLRGQAQWRWDYRRTDGERQSAGVRRYIQMGAQVTRRLTMADLLVAHRTQRDAAGETSRSNLANWTVEARSSDRWLLVNWRGNLTAEEAVLREERLVEVEPGLGHYDSLGHYVGIGDYEFYQAPADSALETRLESAVRMSIQPLRFLLPKDHAWASLEGRLYGRVDLGTPQAVGTLAGNAGSLLWGSGPVRRHNGLLRVELIQRASGAVPAPRVRYAERRYVQRNVTGFERQRLANELEAQVRWTPRAGLTGVGAAAWLDEQEITTRPAAGETRSFDRHRRREGSLESRWAFWGPLTARGRFEAGWDRFEPDERDQRTSELTAGLIADLTGLGRIEAEVVRDWVEPYEASARLFTQRPPGWLGTLSGSIRPRSGYSLTLTMRIDRREDQSRVISGKMEMRAFF